MARCPFAVWDPIPGTTTGGSYLSGPFKIVHHTTEGSTYQSARSAYRSGNHPPHFTVDAERIYQHIDTGVAARALANRTGTPPETNRASAVQIELVGFAGRPKNRRALANVARLCRWIESTHRVPRVWPSGNPRPPRNGRDPGNHNRSVANWTARGGHYGHSQVPENSHWDPAYTREEVEFLMNTGADEADALLAAPMAAEDWLDASPVSVAEAGSLDDDTGDVDVSDTDLEDRGPVLRLGQKVPPVAEATASGRSRGRLPRSSPQLVRNNNPDVVFENSEGNNDDRFMSRRLQEKVNALAQLVKQEWPGVKLRVTDAWDEGVGHSSTSLHYEGRAADMTVFPRDRAKLGRLGRLAVDAGFDWVWYEDVSHVHGSVKRPASPADELSADAGVPEEAGTVREDEKPEVPGTGLSGALEAVLEALEEARQEVIHLSVVGRAHTPEETALLERLRHRVAALDAAVLLLESVSDPLAGS